MTGKNGMAKVGLVVIATQFVSATEGIDCSILFSSVACLRLSCHGYMCNCGSILSPSLLKYVGCFIIKIRRKSFIRPHKAAAGRKTGPSFTFQGWPQNLQPVAWRVCAYSAGLLRPASGLFISSNNGSEWGIRIIYWYKSSDLECTF